LGYSLRLGANGYSGMGSGPEPGESTKSQNLSHEIKPKIALSPAREISGISLK
jgi:hypothetical protein